MLTVNYLINYLNKNQEQNINYELEDFEYNSDIKKTSNDINKKNYDIKESNIIKHNNSIKNIIFNDIKYNLFIIENKDDNKSIIYTIYNSILSIMDKTFFNLNESNKNIEIKKLIKQMSDDLFDKDFYKKYYYRNRKFKRINFMNMFNDALNYKINNAHIYMLFQYISDYIGINILILNENGNEYYKTKYTDYRNTPWCFIEYKNNEYNPVFIESENNFIKKTDKYYDVLINNIKNEMNKDYNENDMIDIKKYDQMKVDDIKKIAIEINIELKKKSDKTGNMINKTKSELIEEIIEKV
jgi:hypothetical protein